MGGPHPERIKLFYGTAKECINLGSGTWTHLEGACAAVAAGPGGTGVLHDLALLAREALGACAAVFIRSGILAGAAVFAGFMGAAEI